MRAAIYLFVACAFIDLTDFLKAAELKVGDEAPAFSLKGSDGKSYSLKAFKGKKAIVIAWFPKAFTRGCTKECVSLRDHSKALRKFQVAYFMASVDEIQKNEEFATSYGLDFPVLSDPDKSVAKKYGVLRTKGNTANRWTFYIGKDGKILHIDKEVKASRHGSDVAKKLAELGVPLKK